MSALLLVRQTIHCYVITGAGLMPGKLMNEDLLWIVIVLVIEVISASWVEMAYEI